MGDEITLGDEMGMLGLWIAGDLINKDWTKFNQKQTEALAALIRVSGALIDAFPELREE